jgi:hypothetical protein
MAYYNGHKLAGLRANIIEGYDEGYSNGITEGKREGKIELLQASKYMNAQASGTVVAVNDVSPVEHDVSVKVSSKNIVPYPYLQTTKTTGGITFTDNKDGSITVNGTSKGGESFYFTGRMDDMLEDGKKYTLSFSGVGNGMYTVITRREKSTGKDGYITGDFTVNKTKYSYKDLRVQIDSSGKQFANVLLCPQIEKGETATPYTPYVADVSTASVGVYTTDTEPTLYPVDGDTATVKSISPNMTLMTDTQGVLMDCSYLRDIDTYIDNLMMNVAMTGGE